MKRVLCALLIAAMASVGVFAEVDGRTSLGVNYGYDGDNLFGLTIDNSGYIDDGVVGYYIGLDAGFDMANINSWRVGMLVGPSYSYDFANVAMSVDASLGVSAAYKTTNDFGFGLGGYIGAAWHFRENMDILLGIKLGSNFVNVNLDSNSWSAVNDFYVVPSIALGFKY